jgi:alkanesulfonate monooxygenase
MQLEFTHVTGPCAAGASAAPPFLAVERAGFGRIVVEDAGGPLANLDLAKEAITSTSTLDIAVNHWADDAEPTAAARQFALLDTASGGRLSVRMVTDATVPGDLASHVEALKRADEHLVLLKRLWANTTPFDHEGPSYSIRRGFVPRKGPRGAAIPIRMNGLCGTAIRIAGRHADVFELPLAPPDQLRHIVGRVRAAACDRGRTAKVRFALPLQFGHWGQGGSPETNLDSALRAGSPERLALALLPYFALGVSELLIRGLDTFEEINAFARHIAPIVRNTAARCPEENIPAQDRRCGIPHAIARPDERAARRDRQA